MTCTSLSSVVTYISRSWRSTKVGVFPTTWFYQRPVRRTWGNSPSGVTWRTWPRQVSLTFPPKPLPSCRNVAADCVMSRQPPQIPKRRRKRLQRRKWWPNSAVCQAPRKSRGYANAPPTQLCTCSVKCSRPLFLQPFQNSISDPEAER